MHHLVVRAASIDVNSLSSGLILVDHLRWDDQVARSWVVNSAGADTFISFELRRVFTH